MAPGGLSPTGAPLEGVQAQGPVAAIIITTVEVGAMVAGVIGGTVLHGVSSAPGVRLPLFGGAARVAPVPPASAIAPAPTQRWRSA